MVLAFQGRKLMGCRLWETGYSTCGFHHEVALPSGHELKTSAARSSLAREHTGVMFYHGIYLQMSKMSERNCPGWKKVLSKSDSEEIRKNICSCFENNTSVLQNI
ncbi:hypothetical protein ACP70R_019803 [Stipagrostis hirtigluma subsp. patula]